MMHVLIFRTAGHLFGIRVEAVEEIVHIAATVHVPGQPPLLDGFLNLRGRPIAVVPLSRLFDSAQTGTGLYAPVIIVRAAQGSIGLLAERVEGVVAIDERVIQPMTTHESLNDCAEGQFESEDGAVILLSADRVLLEKEARCIAELTEQANARLAGLGGPAK
jgi:chemotaxis signal transduction protein